MKKLDLQKGDIKTKLILHVEKIVFGLTVALVAAFVYFGTQRPKIDTDPGRVESAAKQAEENIRKSTWDVVRTERDNPPTYQAAAVRASTPMPGQPYEMAMSFRLRQKESVEKRSDPQILPLEDLEVSAGFAPLAMLDPRQPSNQRGMGYSDYETSPTESYDYTQSYGRGGSLQDDPNAPPELTPEQRRKFSTPRGGQGTIVKGQPFVVVKGLVPLKKQYDQYELEFKDRAQYNEVRDYPNYVWFQVERAEQNPDGSWSDWKTLDANKAFDSAQRLAGYRPEEVAAPWYLDPMLTFPLPPLLLRNPGDWGLHSQVPKYEPPRARQGGMMGGRGMPMPGMRDTEDLPDDEELEPAEDVRRPGLPGPPGIPGVPGLTGRGAGGLMGMGEGGRGMYESAPGYGGEYGRTGRIAPPPGTILRPTGTGSGTGRGSYDAMSYGGEGRGMTAGSSPFDAERKLFRYVDTTVDQNRTYRYRVQLWLEDPNYPLDLQMAPSAQALEPEVLARISEVRKEEEAYNKANPRAPRPSRIYYRQTEFSDPSEGVTTPGSSTVLAGRVEAGRRQYTGNRLMTLRDPVATVLAMTWDDDKEIKAMVTQELKGVGRGSVLRKTADSIWILDPGTLKFEKQEKYNMKTNFLLLDLRGGEDLPGRRSETNKAPGEVLVMDVATGKMAVRSEMEDIDEFHLFNFTKEEVKTPKKDEPDDYYSDYDNYDTGGGRSRSTRGSRRGGGP